MGKKAAVCAAGRMDAASIAAIISARHVAVLKRM
jgi:hypothetical protein